jgi:molybdopterin converting factor small subunit
MIESMEDATLLDLFASLSREISGVKEELSGEIGSVRQELRDGFERVEARLKLHGGLLNGGARQVTRLIEWSEKVNEILAERDARIAELTRRVDKLEGKD